MICLARGREFSVIMANIVMSRKGRIWSIIALMLLIALGTFAAVFPWPSPRNIERIKIGMSYDNVVAMLGPPTSKSQSGGKLDASVYFWNASDGPIYLMFDSKGHVLNKTSRGTCPN